MHSVINHLNGWRETYGKVPIKLWESKDELIHKVIEKEPKKADKEEYIDVEYELPGIAEHECEDCVYIYYKEG